MKRTKNSDFGSYMKSDMALPNENCLCDVVYIDTFGVRSTELNWCNVFKTFISKNGNSVSMPAMWRFKK